VTPALPGSGLGQFLDRLSSGRRHRRTWVGDGRAYIEVRAARRPGLGDFTRHVERELESLHSVQWAEVNAITGRVVVAFDPDATDLDDLVETVEGVEEAHGLHRERFSHERPEHPADIEPLRRNGIALGADVLGLGVSAFGQVLALTPLPTEIAALVALADSEPRVRRFLDAHLGPAASELGLGVANAFGQAFAQGPLGLVVDIAHRGTVIGELRSRRVLWEQREPELARLGRGAVDPVERDARPRPVPAGPVERYADRASMASFGAFGVALAATRSPRLAASALVAGVPKAARLGREAFAAEISRGLAARGVLVMDRSALRRLDRVDTVVVDADVLVTGRGCVARIEVLDGGAGGARTAGSSRGARTAGIDGAEAGARVEALVDLSRPETPVRRGIWSLGPIDVLGAELPRGAATRVRELGRGRARVVGLAHRRRLVALAVIEDELAPSAGSLAEAVRRAGHRLVIAGSRPSVDRRLGADASVPGGRRLRHSVRALQADGHVVLLVASGPAHGALLSADCGFGLTDGTSRPPWGAHLLGGADLAPASFVVDATRLARRASQRSTALSLAGSGIAGVWAVAGLPATAGRRAALPVNVAALAAQASSTISAATAARRSPQASPVPPPEWHAMSPEEVEQALGSTVDGLDSAEAGRRATPSRPRRPFALRLGRAVLDELSNPLTPVLAVGAGLSAAVGSAADAVLVSGVTGVNAAIGAAQRLRAEVSLDRLAEASTAMVGVRRDGRLAEVAHDRLVYGDVVELTGGDQVPADCRILEAQSCEVDESSLTGESLPVVKYAVATPGAAVADRACMLYEGTTVVVGTALAVVVATGEATEARRGLADAPGPPPSGVESRLAKLTALTVPVTVASGAAVSALGIARGVPVRRAVGSGVGLMVAAVPEGLPLLASAAQLSAARRLATRGALVRNPRTIEALGRVDVLCFDKTGTLTAGHIALQRVSDGERDDTPDRLEPSTRRVLAAALRASPVGDGAEVLRHATDRAVVDGGVVAGLGPEYGVGTWSQQGELAFESSRAFHAVVGFGDTGPRVVAKGAPEAILPRCASWRSPGGPRALDARTRRRLEAEVERLADQGLRVLAVAERQAVAGGILVDERVSSLELLGFLGLADHVRPTAAAAVAGLALAGVEVVMITGDHPSTATAVATDLGILDSKAVVTGPELDAMTEAELEAMVGRVSVFARVTPAHKVRIVGAFQHAGKVVAMTGDGANDAPAIRLADAGVALGRRGAPAAREAADLVVVDDRIETIVEAIVEGRAMWASVRDALAILVGGNLGEVAFSLTTSVLTGSSALGARQFLLVNLLTDLVPAMTIALRPPTGRSPESLLHEGPDVALGTALLTQVAIRAAATAGGATGAWLVARGTGRRRRASTVALAALVGTQLAQTAVVGRRSPLVLGATAASGAVLVGIIQMPGVSQFFGCTPLGPVGWGIAGGATALATVGSVVVPAVLPAVASFVASSVSPSVSPSASLSVVRRG